MNLKLFTFAFFPQAEMQSALSIVPAWFCLSNKYSENEVDSITTWTVLINWFMNSWIESMETEEGKTDHQKVKQF